MGRGGHAETVKVAEALQKSEIDFRFTRGETGLKIFSNSH